MTARPLSVLAILGAVCVPLAALAGDYSNRTQLPAGEEPVLRALDPEVCAMLLARFPKAPDYSAGGGEVGPPADLPGGTVYRPEALEGWVELPLPAGPGGGRPGAGAGAAPGGRPPGRPQGHGPGQAGGQGSLAAGMVFSVEEPVGDNPMTLGEALAACRAMMAEDAVPQK